MSSDLPHWVTAPFVVEHDPVKPVRQDNLDLYLPESEAPAPAVLFCGGPVPEGVVWGDPRLWPVYQGYGVLLAQQGVVGVPVALPMHELSDFPRAADVLAQSVEAVRNHERVDADRIGLWLFCGGSSLISDWLRETPPWLRVFGLTYPSLGSRPGVDFPPRFQPHEALAEAGDLPPIVLTTVGIENPEIAKTVETFLAAADEHNVKIQNVHVPNGHHGFDFIDYTEESVTAIHQAIGLVVSALR
jgi:acetyl esterase/lipase